jgi:hypothetical protein
MSILSVILIVLTLNSGQYVYAKNPDFIENPDKSQAGTPNHPYGNVFSTV